VFLAEIQLTKNNFFKKVNTFSKDHGIGIHMIAGDFNETLKEIDRRSNSSTIVTIFVVYLSSATHLR
jgi:hypothetical protein